MRLVRSPVRPTVTAGELFVQYLERYGEWQPFLVGWLPRRRSARDLRNAAAG
jgi:hypothetical protein